MTFAVTSVKPVPSRRSSSKRGDGVFYEENNDECCKYINFWLNNEIKKQTYPLYNGSNFHIFNDFVKKFNNIKDKSRCLSNLNDIDTKSFGKMSKLYEMYDLYLDLKESYSRTQKKTKCNIFGQLIGDHNRSLTDYQDSDTPFVERLINLKGLIENLKLQFNDQCPYKISELHISKLEGQRKKEEIQKQQEALEKEQQKLKMQEEETRRQQEKTRRQLEEATGEASQQRITTLQSGNDVLGSGRGPESVIEKVTVSEPQAQELHSYGTLRTHVGKGSMGQLEYRRTVESPEQLELTDDRSLYPQNGLEIDQGTVGKITGAITGVLREVEPGPILGVSGGMGALFLLFKYTPVGSFFGGRRRRIHQIPSSFRGLSPGEFPIFQEHDVGYIGYGAMNTSLAE
ncbi:PIR protein [Plasmodium vivax]|uniref:VIR protein n=1 Tax=Plasmodium vivax TaxID=5855 RepID=A0A565A6U4_PLAVI|nr:PIR protein [Plasmodium vivax]